MRLSAIGLLSLALLSSGLLAEAEAQTSLTFDPEHYSLRTDTVEGRPVVYRAYEGIVYVARPIDAQYQCMNIYIPEAYFHREAIGRYTSDTAPIFLPNNVGGYMPATPIVPQIDRRKATPNAALEALARGYVVASPGARGRSLHGQEYGYYGKAPAGIVDLKAAVAYLHHNDCSMPGNAQRIVSNGTSAGGAMSALLGATGDVPDYLPYLRALGAAPASTRVFAVSAYCPITDLEHADMAYEWQYAEVQSYRRVVMRGMIDFRMQREEVSGAMTDAEQTLARSLASLFPSYVNSLSLVDDEGRPLQLSPDGRGSFHDYVLALLEQSAQRAYALGVDVAQTEGVSLQGRTIRVAWLPYLRGITRMKLPPAFDALDLSSGENDLFGDSTTQAKHFTPFGQGHSTASGAQMAPQAIIGLMNPMHYIASPGAHVAQYWRIRHGAKDRDTSLAIPIILALKLRQAGKQVDLALPWGVPHSGDYDLDELFAWVDSLPE